MGVGQHEDPDKTGRSGRFQQGEINDASGNLTAFLILLQLIGQNHLHKKMFITPLYFFPSVILYNFFVFWLIYGGLGFGVF